MKLEGKTQEQLLSLILQYFQHPKILFTRFSNLSTTIVPPSLCLQVCWQFYLSPITFKKSFLCFVPSTTSCFPSLLLHVAYSSVVFPLCFCMLLIVVFSSLQGCNLLVCSPSDSHHQGLVATFRWQPIAWCSKNYPWSTHYFLSQKNAEIPTLGSIQLT